MVQFWLWAAGMLWFALIVGFTPTDGRGAGAPTLALRLEVLAGVRVRTPVPFKLTLQNLSNRSVTLTLGGRPAYDVVVTTPGGQEIWRWSQGKAIQQILERKTLEPGEALAFTAVWDQDDNAEASVPAGTYRVQGVVKLDPPEQLETEPTPLSLLP